MRQQGGKRMRSWAKRGDSRSETERWSMMPDAEKAKSKRRGFPIAAAKLALAVEDMRSPQARVPDYDRTMAAFYLLTAEADAVVAYYGYDQDEWQRIKGEARGKVHKILEEDKEGVGHLLEPPRIKRSAKPYSQKYVRLT